MVMFVKSQVCRWAGYIEKKEENRISERVIKETFLDIKNKLKPYTWCRTTKRMQRVAGVINWQPVFQTADVWRRLLKKARLHLWTVM